MSSLASKYLVTEKRFQSDLDLKAKNGEPSKFEGSDQTSPLFAQGRLRVEQQPQEAKIH